MKEDSFFKTNADISENIEQKKDSFDLELEKFNSGNLPDSHIFNLGKPGEILQNCGFPAEHRIELAASRLRMKANQGNHPFEILDIQGLAGALQKPVAVFEYGDKNKSQNVIVNIEKDGKNFLVGVFFNQIRDGFEVSSIRGLFNRDNMDWMHWIQQGKMIYGNKEKIQVLAEQQRTNLADVHSKEARTSSDSYYLDSVDNILQSFGDVKDIYTKDFPKYAEQKERFEIFKKFRNAYQEVNAINVLNAVQEADEFYDALKSNNKEVIARYTDAFKYPALADTAKSIIEERSFSQKEKSQEIQCAELLMAQGLDSLDSNKILHQTNSLVNKITPTLVIDSNQAARIKAAREIKENMPNLSENERTAAIAILEAGAKSQGMEFSEYVEKTFPDGIFGDIKKAENVARQQGVKINGAVSVNGFGENVKAVIYAGKTADFSTWCHELSHVWQAQLAGELKNDAEEAFQVKNSDWQNSIYTFKDGHTDTSAEAFAYGFEDFLKNKAGEMAAENKKKIFEKFADYMSRTYNGVKQHIEINEKIASVYQKFVELDDNILAQAEKAVQMENTFGKELFEKIKTKQELTFSESQKLYPNIVDLSEEFVNQAPSEKEVLEKLRSMVGEIYATSTDGKTLRIPQGRDKLSHIFKGDNYKRDFRKKRELNRKLAYNAEKIIGNAVFTEAELAKPEKNKDYLLGMHNYEVPVFVNGHGFLVRLEGEVIKKLPTSAPGSIPVQKNTSIESNIDNNELLLKLQATEVSDLYVIRKQKVLFQTAYHGSGANFDKFNTSEYGWSGEGYMAFGYGTYVTDSESIAKDYASAQGKREPGKRNFYTVEIPDGNYLKWEKKVGVRTIKKVATELENLGIKNISFIRKDFRDWPLATQLNYIIHNESMTNKGSGKDLYITVGTILHSPADKETSKFFKDIGFSGIEYPAGTFSGERQNAVNYVIFDDEDIKIKEHFQFQKKEEERTMKSTETFESQEYWKNQFQQENADTFKAIDDYLDKGIKPKNDEFIFEKVPEILKSANVSENEIVIKTSIINKAKNEHSLSDEEIKDSIKNIASPVLIFNSDKTTTENKKESFLCLTDTFAENGKPIAFSMNLDSDYEKSRSILNVNQITSIHDRTLIAKNGTDLIQKWTENGLCRYVDDKKISEWQLAARVQFPLAVLHSDINNINLSSKIVNSTDYQEIQTFSEFAEQQKAMEKEYQEYLGTISPDEESSRRIDSGEIFGKLENQQSKEELNVATYKFQSGETLDEIIQGNSDFSTETALLDNLIDNSIREVYEYATNEEKSVLRQFAAFRNDYDTDMKNLAVQTDCISRWIAAEHWNPEKQEFQKEYVNQSAIKDFPYKLPWEMKEIEDKVLKTENEIFDNGIESIQVNGGMSEAAIEAEIRSQEKDHHEVEEYNDGQLPLQVVAHTDFNYFNSDKISFKEYIVRTDASVVQDLIEKNADSFNETNSKLEENAIPCIIVRKSVNPEIPDQFLLSKYENNNLNKDEIAKQAGKFASKEIKIENTELITQIKNVIDWNDKQNKTQSAIPELKIYHTLKEDEENISQVAEKSINEQKTKLQIIEQEDKEQLAAIVMTARKTIKESLAQNADPLVEVDFSKANYDMLFPRAIVQTPLETVKLGENQFEKLDAKDRKRFLLATFQTLATPDLVIDEEREGKHSHNYIKSFVFDEKTKTIQDVVVNINGENVSITAHPRDINNIVNKIKMPDQLVYAAAKVGQVIEQRTQEAQSIVNPTRDDRLSTISVPLNKEYNENFALSTVEKLLETEKNAQKATAPDFQQIEPALQKKFDKLKAAIKSREEQDIQDISAEEEPGNKKKAIRSKSDIIRQAGKDFLKSVKEGIAPFFNAEDDFQRIIMHPQAIINASNGLPFSGESQLLAQIYHQRQRMEGEVVTSIAGAKAAGTIVLDTPESRQKNFALTDTSSLAEKNAIVRTRYFMPESCEEPDKIYAHTLQRQRPDKIRSYRDLIRHFENIPNGQKEISDIRIRIAHEHLKEIQSRFAIKEKRVLSVDEIEERKNFLRNYFERLPADYRNSERSAFEDTFGIQLNSEKNLEINLQRDFKDIDFAELKKNTKKSIELENRKLSDFIEKNTMEDKKLATLLSDEYKSLSKEEKMTVRNLKIEAIGIKEPETFLGKYLAACNSNAEFITDKETVEEVKKNLVKKLEENFKLEKYDILKEIGQQAQSIGNETTKKISFEKAHSNNKSLEKTQSPDKEISLIGMGK